MQYLRTQDKTTGKTPDIHTVRLNLKKVLKLKRKYIDVIKNDTEKSYSGNRQGWAKVGL